MIDVAQHSETATSRVTPTAAVVVQPQPLHFSAVRPNNEVLWRRINLFLAARSVSRTINPFAPWTDLSSLKIENVLFVITGYHYLQNGCGISYIACSHIQAARVKRQWQHFSVEPRNVAQNDDGGMS
jgi:hypothetical protein